MSWDTMLMIDTGGPELAYVEEVRNVTYNNGKIFNALGVHPDELKDIPCKDVAIKVIKALGRIPHEVETLKKLDPPNGWGGVEDAADYLMKLYLACIRHPNAELKFC